MLDNIMNYGVGGINIDGCRIKLNGENQPKGSGNACKNDTEQKWGFVGNGGNITSNLGRFPSNTLLTYGEDDYDEVCGGFPYTKNSKRSSNNNKNTVSTNTYTPPKAIYTDDNTYGDEGSASRYFYCAKASKKDRDEGCDNLQDTYNACSNQAIAELKRGNENFSDKKNSTFNKVYVGKNTHPTVKPTELMQYLVRLVSPRNSIILDPFMGSGSTGKAVAYENNERNMDYKFIGIELDDTYMTIAKARILYADGNRISIETNKENNTEEVVAVKKLKQQRLF